jgi:hypothetical protein
VPIGERESLNIPALPERLLLGAVFLTYLAGTALLYFWGPWTYPITSGRRPLITFLVAVHAAFGIGYLTAIAAQPRAARSKLSINNLVLISVGIQLALLPLTSHFATGSFFPNPWGAASNLGVVYTESLARRSTGTPYINYLRILIAPILLVAVPLSLFYWHLLRPMTQFLFALFVIGTLMLHVAMGTNSAAGEWMALFPWFVVAAHLSGVHRLGRAGWAKAIGVQFLSLMFFGLLFSATMAQRTGSFVPLQSIPGVGATLRSPTVPQTPSLRSADPGTSSTPNATSPAVTPQTQRPSISTGIYGLAAYFSHGYHAVYLSLSEPFVGCNGVGNSVFLQRQMAKLTGDPGFVECTYPHRIQRRGWDAAVYWSTIYPWIASDVGFPGTVLIIFVVGWLAGRVWLDVLGGQNPFAVILLAPVLLILYYIPAHNRMLQTGEGVVGLPVLLLAWAVANRRNAPVDA